MRIISYILDVSVPGARIHFRNPRWYTKPEPRFDYVIAKQEKIIDDYRQMGVPAYSVPEEKENQTEEVIVEEEIIEELSWNEMRRLAKELSGEVIKSKEQAQEILNQHGY